VKGGVGPRGPGGTFQPRCWQKKLRHPLEFNCRECVLFKRCECKGGHPLVMTQTGLGTEGVLQMKDPPLAKFTVLVIQQMPTNCVQANDNNLEVLLHIILYLSTRWPQIIGSRGHVINDFLKLRIFDN